MTTIHFGVPGWNTASSMPGAALQNRSLKADALPDDLQIDLALILAAQMGSKSIWRSSGRASAFKLRFWSAAPGMEEAVFHPGTPKCIVVISKGG
jgi:hypothetical protein